MDDVNAVLEGYKVEPKRPLMLLDGLSKTTAKLVHIYSLQITGLIDFPCIVIPTNTDDENNKSDVELFTQYIIQYPEFKTMLGLGASHMRS